MHDEDARAGTTKKIDEPSPEAAGTAPVCAYSSLINIIVYLTFRYFPHEIWFVNGIVFAIVKRQTITCDYRLSWI